MFDALIQIITGLPVLAVRATMYSVYRSTLTSNEAIQQHANKATNLTSGVFAERELGSDQASAFIKPQLFLEATRFSMITCQKWKEGGVKLTQM